MAPPTLLDYLTPTEITLVSRAWVLTEVAQVEGLTEPQRARLVDDLIAYSPPRKHGLRNNLIVWFSLLGCTLLAGGLGAPPWTGFVVMLAVLFVLARVLAVKALRWRIGQWIDEERVGRAS